MKPEDRKQIALIEHCAKRIHEKAEQACKYCYDKFGVENSPDGLLEDIAEMALSIQVQAGNLCASRDAQPAVAVNEQLLEDVALIAHHGGLIGLSERDALILIRKITVESHNWKQTVSETVAKLKDIVRNMK